MEKNNKPKFTVSCANCGMTAWVTEDDLRYCKRCYEKIARMWSKR